MKGLSFVQKTLRNRINRLEKENSLVRKENLELRKKLNSLEKDLAQKDLEMAALVEKTTELNNWYLKSKQELSVYKDKYHQAYTEAVLARKEISKEFKNIKRDFKKDSKNLEK